MGLSPKQPVAYIDTPKYICYLYDPDNPESVRPKRQASAKQIENLAKGRKEQERKRKYRQWYNSEGFIEKDRACVVRWVQEFIAQEDFVILDTETTGLDDEAEVIEIAIINYQQEVLINTLICPTIAIDPEAKSVHKIADWMLENAPTFTDAYPYLQQALDNKKILIYNDDFDKRVINYCCKLHGLKKLIKKGQTRCLMEWYAQWYGDFSSYWDDYRYQPLDGGHTALSDCFQALNYLQAIAEDDPNFNVPKYLKD